MNYAIILAAGKGTRMKVEAPKCAVKLLGKPMVSYLIDNLKNTSIDKPICVVGHKKEVFFDLLKGQDVLFAIQEEQLGTGHAVKCAKEFIKEDGYTIILPGDTPLIDEGIINGLIDEHVESGNSLTIGTIILENPFGYGRMVRNESGNVIAIVEEKDASEALKKIKEINSGLMCVDNKLLFEALDQVKNDNAKGEYYLTDIVKILSKEHKVGTHTFKDAYKLAGINDLYHLYEVETELRRDINKKHMLNGVQIEASDTVTIGPDVTIDSNAIIKQGSIILGHRHIKAYEVVGPYAYLDEEN